MALADLLRSARERRGQTLDQLADETRIPVDRLAAFEQDGLALNSGFYQRAQIRAYAHALNLDEDLVLKEIKSDLDFVPAPPPVEHLASRRGFTVSVPVKLLCIAVAAFIGTSLLHRDLRPARAAQAARSTESAPAAKISTSASAPGAAGQNATVVPTISAGSLGTVGLGDPAAAHATAPAVPAAAPVTQLEITSNPQGARVTVDGVGWGVTPVTIRHLPEGLKRVRITSDGYAASERVVEIRPDRATKISIQLRPSAPPVHPAS
jgi:cytoskeletal protein RodZ